MNHRARTVYFLSGLALLLLIAFLLFASLLFSPSPTHDVLSHFDTLVSEYVQPTHGQAQFFLFITYLASPEVIIAIELALIILLILGRRKMLAGLFVAGLILGEIVALSFKDLFERARPASLYNLPRSGYAFPSGHALIAMVFYGFAAYCLIQLFRERWQKILITCLAGILIFLIGLSRIALGFHWPTDVIAGWILGAAVLCIIIAAYIHAHVHIYRLHNSTPHGLKLALIIIAAAFISFYIFGFYVTHPLEFRSTMEYQLTA